MRENEYYDTEDGIALTSAQGCPLEEWRSGATSAKFALHESGFPVFLRPSEIDDRDEYGEDDPYDVLDGAGEMTSFHQCRLNGTVRLLEEATQHVRTHPKILDLGCGLGHITAQIQRRFPSAEVSGLDASISAIAAAKKSYEGIDFVVADAYRPPYIPGYFDIVVCNNIWEHVPDPLRLLEAIKRILSPEGVLIISTPSRYRLGNIARVLVGKPVKLISPHHVTEYTVGQVIEQLRFGGFDAKVFNEPWRAKSSGAMKFTVRKVVRPLVQGYLRMLHSHHSLEWTVFYIAQRRRPPRALRG
jgi:2-polyprenyl-3-methyl-5-hydroxy-6-metoxy-1,4-benzoquinol methylase